MKTKFHEHDFVLDANFLIYRKSHILPWRKLIYVSDNHDDVYAFIKNCVGTEFSVSEAEMMIDGLNYLTGMKVKVDE